MTRLRKLTRTLLLTKCVSLSSIALACGLWVPEPYLLRNDDFFYEPPQLGFAKELERALPASVSHQAVLGAEQSSAAREADLAHALQDQGLDVDAIVASYRQIRQLIKVDDLDAPVFEIPAHFPDEFRLYLEGARDYHRDDYEAARSAWQALLDLPKEERHYRSVWAAFMLARTDKDNAQSIDHYQQVRALAREGFADSGGLAAASYGREAQIHLSSGAYSRAIELYLKQFASGYDNAVESLETTACAALDAVRDYDELSTLVIHPEARVVLTAYLLDQGADERYKAKRDRWLFALDYHETKLHLSDAGRLALLEYQSNDLDACRRWLTYAAADDALALWITGKLLLREGKVSEGQTILLALGRQIEAEADDPDWTRLNTQTAWAELGILLVRNGRYSDAANAFSHAGSWQDLAYILERLLTIEELLEWVETYPSPSSEAEYARADHQQVNALIARRLMREGKFHQALDFFDAAHRNKAQAYIDAMRAAHDTSSQAQQRAKYFWTAAEIMRHSGIDLFAVELAPDYAWWDGNPGYLEDIADFRSRPTNYFETPDLTGIHGDEHMRLYWSRLRPNKRFHYRYRAAELAEIAAGLLPNNSEDAARIYLTAGGWLKNRDPDTANRLYRQLVIRCPNTQLGKAAAEASWFPDVDLDESVPFEKAL